MFYKKLPKKLLFIKINLIEYKYRKKHSIFKGALLQNLNPNSMVILWKAKHKKVLKKKI